MEENMKIYIIESHGGQYDDSYSHKIMVTTCLDKAIAAAEKDWDENGNWTSRMPVPLEIFYRYQNTFQTNEEPDSDDDEAWENYEETIYQDLGGYTKEEWIKSDELYWRHMNNEYSWTDIKEYVDGEMISEYKEPIWSKSKIDDWKHYGSEWGEDY